MKRRINILIMICIIVALAGCGSESSIDTDEQITEVSSQEAEDSDVSVSDDTGTDSEDGIDVDLTTLSSTMVYAEVYNMYMYPDDYLGEIVKMEGTFSVLEVEETNMRYFSVVIEDALGCCAQGVEFELAGEYTYPGDYPEVDTVVTVIGEFETYEEYGYLYCRLKDATLTIN